MSAGMTVHLALTRIRHDGRLFDAGEEIALGPEAAQRLLDLGAIADSPSVEDPELDVALTQTIRALPPGAFGASGKPGVDAIRAANPALTFGGEDRDRVWSVLVESGFKAPEKETTP